MIHSNQKLLVQNKNKRMVTLHQALVADFAGNNVILHKVMVKFLSVFAEYYIFTQYFM